MTNLLCGCAYQNNKAFLSVNDYRTHLLNFCKLSPWIFCKIGEIFKNLHEITYFSPWTRSVAIKNICNPKRSCKILICPATMHFDRITKSKGSSLNHIHTKNLECMYCKYKQKSLYTEKIPIKCGITFSSWWW